MSYVIQIEWMGGLNTKEPTEHAGRYVSHYDPDAHGGLGEVWTTPDPRAALQFKSVVLVADFLRQTSTVKPVREDGKPNRPINAYTLSIFDWERA